MKQAVIIYGPPGAGKGTQAELLARLFDFVHFDTGRYIERVVHAPENRKNKVIRREEKLFDTGKLCTPEWVLKITADEAGRIANSDLNIAFSGSPRTIFEAYGDKKNKGLIEVLTKLYGKKNITIVRLNIHEGSSLRRNSARLVCSVCGLPILATVKNNHCSLCGGAFRKRTLDNPAVIKVRLEEYQNRTFPIVSRLRKLKYRIIEMDGEPAPYLVHKAIAKKLGFSK